MPEVENPTKLDDITVKKLEEAFAIDASVEEACFYANISRQTYYNWMESFPDLKDRFDALRNKPVLKARQEVVKGLDGNPEFSLKYLERKKKAEFSIRTETDITSKDEKIESNLPPEVTEVLKQATDKLKESLSK